MSNRSGRGSAGACPKRADVLHHLDIRRGQAMPVGELRQHDIVAAQIGTGAIVPDHDTERRIKGQARDVIAFAA